MSTLLHRTLRRAAAAAAVGATVASGLVLGATSAEAAVFSTYGSGVTVRAEPSTGSASVGSLSGPTSIDVDCQAAGELVDLGNGAASSWWAHVPALGGYVTVAYVDVADSKLPGVPECGGETPPPSTGDVTLADLQAAFPGQVGDPAIVEAGLPGLNAEMAAAGITTPARKAAFLATLANESTFEYDIREGGDTREYGGRGYIQLTGESNYADAGAYIGVDLLGNPDAATAIENSARIATWYWTVARSNSNALADALDMGGINANIGYPVGDGSEDQRRCADANAALAYFGGSGTFSCNR